MRTEALSKRILLIIITVGMTADLTTITSWRSKAQNHLSSQKKNKINRWCKSVAYSVSLLSTKLFACFSASQKRINMKLRQA